MNRYPDTIIILRPIGDSSPYANDVTWEQVYSGRCRCFLDRQSAFRTNKVMDCTHQVVIPDRYMPEIGENFKVGIKMHTNKSNRNWDLVGYVKDFARYDRVCNLYFQMVKENLIAEDVPGPIVDANRRVLNVVEDTFFQMESVGLVREGVLAENEVLTLNFLRDSEGDYSVKFMLQDENGEWSEEEARLELPILDHYTKDGNRVFVLAAYYNEDYYPAAFMPNTIRIEIVDNNSGDKIYTKDIEIVEG